MYMFFLDRWYTRQLGNSIDNKSNGGETFDKPKNISNNPGESRKSDLALLQ